MPQIKQVENQVDGLRPDDRGIDATLQVARRAGAFYNQQADAVKTVGDQLGRNANSAINAAGDKAVDYMEHREISHGAAAYANLNDQLTQAWNETAKSADPNDPTVAANFRENVLEPQLQKYKEGFLTEGGQKFAEARIDSLRNHMFEKTAADMGTLAADAVSVNVKQMANGMTNTAARDPTSVPHLLDGIDASVGALVDSSPNLKGAAAAKARMQLTEQMREKIVEAGAIGAIAKAPDPEAEAQKWGDKYPEYISGDKLKALSANARQQIRADRTDRAYADHLDKVQIQDNSDETETKYLQKIYSDDPKQQGEVSTKAVVNDPNLTRTSKERLINVVNREMKPETSARISAQTSSDLFREMRDPNADPQKLTQKIFDARAKDPGEAGSLTKADFTDLQKQLIDLKTPEGLERTSERNEFFKRFAPTIDPSMGDIESFQFGHHTALGQQKMYEAEKALRNEEKRLGPDWRKLYDPSSPQYFGKPENIMKYRASMQAATKYQADMSDKNLTGPGKKETGAEVINVPPGMSPGDAMKAYKSGTRLRLPDGRTGVVP